MSTAVVKKILQPPYVEPSAWQGYEYVELVAKSGTKCVVNSCVMAAVSPFCMSLLKSMDNSGNGLCSIVTELTSDELQAFHLFVTTGNIFNYKSSSDLFRDQQVVSLFDCFGIRLESLNFSQCDGDGTSVGAVADEHKLMPPAKSLPKAPNDEDHWRNVRKKELENKRHQSVVPPKNCNVSEVQDSESVFRHEDGRLSFPKGLVLKEYKQFRSTYPRGVKVNQTLFTKELITKSFGKELPSPLPSSLSADIHTGRNSLERLLKKQTNYQRNPSRKSTQINLYEVRTTYI